MHSQIVRSMIHTPHLLVGLVHSWVDGTKLEPVVAKHGHRFDYLEIPRCPKTPFLPRPLHTTLFLGRRTHG